MNERTTSKIRRERETLEILAESDLPAAPVARALLRAYQRQS